MRRKNRRASARSFRREELSTWMPPRLHSDASSRSARENLDKLKFGQRLRARNVDVRAFTRTDEALSFRGARRIKCGASSRANHAPAKPGAGTHDPQFQ